MSATWRWIVGFSLVGMLACGPGETPEGDAAGGAPPIEGHYDVTGVTIDEASGNQRQISGRISLVPAEGARYNTHFEFSTLFPGSEAAAANIVGAGEVVVDGRTFTGTIETQIVLAAVPGVDVGFAFMPKQVGPRIVSSSTGQFFDDGTVRIELETRPAEGEEEYSPTRSTLVGYRLEEKAPTPSE